MGKSIIEALKNLMRRVPGKAWLAVGGLLVGAFWLQQHDARIRQQARLQQLRNQTSAQVAVLRRQAAQDVKQANIANAKAIAELEQRRQQAVKQNRQLAAQLARLRQQAHIQAGEVATLPISEIVTRVATQLGLSSGDVAGNAEASSRKGAKAQSKLQVTNDELQKAAAGSAPCMTQNTPHPAAGASTLSPRRGRGQASIADAARVAASAEADHPAGRNAGVFRSAQDDRNAALALTASGARKVEGALVALNACRAESKIQAKQVSACQARAEADEAEVNRLQSSVAGLNHALDAKDKILAQQQNECKAELRAARGTFLGRLAHTVEHVAVGVAMGVVIGVAVK